jgi:hypothetical protein
MKLTENTVYESQPLLINHESLRYQELQNHYKHSQRLRDEANQTNKIAILEALAAAGITSVEVSFDGYGDSGQIENITSYVGQTAVMLGSMPIQFLSADSNPPRLEPRMIKSAIEDFCYDLLETAHPGWEIDEGSTGNFTFNVGERLIVLSGEARYVEYESLEEEF